MRSQTQAHMKSGGATDETPPEADLVARARQGDPAAWEALVRAHQQPAFRLAYLILGDADDAEDAAQEAFIRAYHALARFDASRPLRPWLLSIAANLARNRRRSLGRYWRNLQRMVMDEAQTGKTVETASLESIQAGQLWQAVRRLGVNDQQMIYLRFFLDLSVEETAETLGIVPGTVKSRLHRSLARLRALVQKEYPGLKELLE
jgi:RNA polymerase sigma factor (sigma-70 family)